MKLIGKLKEKVDQAESLEVKKGLIEEAGVALTDDELEKVAGGTGVGFGPNDRVDSPSTIFHPRPISR